ncbi:chaperone protein DNAK, putative [Entamoeba dispar SAW760]|uniref:Chaperone protein DNAK, putative n=1 Tax=Entamoeba dispar (strain ATCC PRA-260 / SAW760) TaxID=370354 RepID=B0EET4_ENTDS|nr:chaperone protein DNAK, putative [Entamoeba dispar SAW760]EDR26967.1 chaperone protein DNAK, putative [Entamoeba dispar SAW760]|eukprot:EDR26967.1 chaperone protein DNAK, putative [Entamoeba dispar SAW760]
MSSQKVVSVGIDLGTTCCYVACVEEGGGPKILLNNGEDYIPSWISLSHVVKGSGVVVGKSAKNDFNSHCVGYDSKRLVGRKVDEIKDWERSLWSFDVVEKYGMSALSIYNPLTQENEVFVAEEVSCFLVRALIDVVKGTKSNPIIDRVVVTVPVNFNDSQRLATERAVRLAGVKEVSILNEPSATIIAYQNEFQIKEGEKVIVIDFGGGTLDVCCCFIEKHGIKVLSNGGNQNLGGNDFDKVISDIIKQKAIDFGVVEDYYWEKTEKDTKEEINKKSKRLTRLKKESERVKIELSKQGSVSINLENLIDNDILNDDEIVPDISISQEEFQEGCNEVSIMDDFTNCVLDVLRRAGLNEKTVDLVIPVGGSCLVPCVRDRISKMFSSKKMAECKFDRRTSVAKGAALEASKNTQIKIFNLYETVPFDIGFEVSGKRLDTFIKAGDKLPHSSIKKFLPEKKNQTYAVYSIYRGTSSYIENDEFVESVTIKGIPGEISNRYEMTVKCKVDGNGIVEIEIYHDGKEERIGEIRVEMDLKKYEKYFEEMKRHIEIFYR